MRILQITPRYPPQTGGVETHVRAVSEGLAARGHEVTVLTADAGPDVARRETHNGVDVRRHRSLAPGGAFHAAPGVAASVRRLPADVVHAHNYHSLPLFAAALAAGGSRLVLTPHYHGESDHPVRNALLSAYRPVGGWALRRADAVVAVSEWERDQLRAAFGVEPTVVPNGIDREWFRTATPEERDRPYLLCVGRLEEYKRIQDVIRALPSLPAFDLVVAGDGPERDRLESVAADSGVADRVHFEGYVGDDRLPSLYAGASVYVTLSQIEAYGMTVGEALAAGTPCIVAETGALAEWTRYEGCVGVAARDPETVAAAVKEAADLSPDAALPDWSEVTDRLLDIYTRS
ncbi:MAG: glycosyltransferase family 4 protein, partial [Halobacteriaceae archaeon]